jgi:hypothetical protein
MLKIVVSNNDEITISKEIIEYLKSHNIFFTFEYDLLSDYTELEYNGRKIKVQPGDDINDLIRKVVDGEDNRNDRNSEIFKVRWDRILSSGALV